MAEFALVPSPQAASPVAPPPQLATHDHQGHRAWLSPAELAGTLWRNWPLLLICGLIVGGAAYAYSALALPKRFTSNGVVTVESRGFNIPALQGALSSEGLADPMPMVRSEVQVLQSRALIQAVADELHLERDPEFNAALRPPSLNERVKKWLALNLPSAIASPFVSAGVLPDLSKPTGPIPPNVLRDNVYGAVAHELGVSNDNRSMIINIQFTAEQPDVAAAVVNSLIKHYMEAKTAVRDNANADANATLHQRVIQVRDEVAALEQKIADTRQKYNLVQTRAGSVGQQQLEDLSAALTKASSDRAQLEANYARAAVLARTGGNEGSDVFGSSTISQLRDREATAERRVAELSATLGPNHPALRAAQAQVASARAAINSEIQRVMASLGAQVEASRAREADLKRQLGAAQEAAGSLSSVQSELAQLEKDAEARRVVYQQLLQGEAATATDSKKAPIEAGVRVVSTAVPPAYPSSPKPKVSAMLGFVGGAAIGGALALTRKRRDRGFAKPEELVAGTGLTPYAVVPKVSGRGGDLPDRVLVEPQGPEAEALRTLRMRLRFSGRATAPQSVLFIGARAGEGATSMAAAFARIAAADGLRVLLLEGDLQTPSLGGMLRIPGARGMVEVLEGTDHWRDTVSHDPASRLDCLLVGKAQPVVSQLLEGMQLRNLLADAKEDYNLVVVDAQPVGETTSSLVLAHIVDAVVLVVAAAGTPRRAVRDAIAGLSSAARRPPVIALNKA